MTTVSVGNELEDQRAFASGTPFLTEGGGGLDGEDVHTVDLETRNVLTTLVVVGQGGSTGSGSTHTIFVVCWLS